MSASKMMRAFFALPLLAGVVVGVAKAPSVLPGKAAPHGMTKATAQAAYGKLPLSFIPNRGQQRQGVDYMSTGNGYALELAPTEASLTTGKAGGDAASTNVVHMRLLGANAAATARAGTALGGKVNYLMGSDPAHWQRDLPTFGTVSYAGVWPGIDVVYHGHQGEMEYDFVVAPGADPGAIALGIDGAKSLRLDGNDLVMRLDHGDLRQHAPRLYQDEHGTRRPVDGHFLLDGSRVGFAVGAYDHTKPLVIDPTLAYSTYLGGGGVDYGNGIAIDAAGNAYVTGWTFRDNFPTTAGAVQPTRPSGNAAFVTKMNADGSGLVYSTYLGGNSYLGGGTVQYGAHIAVDSVGDAYVVGGTTTSDFPTTATAFQKTAPDDNDSGDLFVTELNPSGSALVYSTYLGGTGADGPGGIALGPDGSAYVTGATNSPDYPVTSGALQTAPVGGSDAFVTKLNPTGSAPLYSTYLGGSADDSANGIAVDSGGNAVLAGETRSTDLPTVGSAVQPALGGGADAFVAKVDASGSRLLLDTYLGGTGDDSAKALALDSDGSMYLTGSTTSTNFPVTASAFQKSSRGGSDVFVTKIAPNGSALGYSTYVGGTIGENAGAIAVDSQGRAFVGGSTVSVDFPLVKPIQRQKCCPKISPPDVESDAFVFTLDSTGSRLVFSTYLGGTDNDEVLGLQVDGSGNAYLAGMTRSPHHAYAGPYKGNYGFWPTTRGAFQPRPPDNSWGPENAFVTKISGI